jgi:hypothetical protein
MLPAADLGWRQILEPDRKAMKIRAHNLPEGDIIAMEPGMTSPPVPIDAATLKARAVRVGLS